MAYYTDDDSHGSWNTQYKVLNTNIKITTPELQFNKAHVFRSITEMCLSIQVI